MNSLEFTKLLNQKNFLQQNLLTLIEVAQQGLSEQGKGLIIVDLESRHIKSINQKLINYELQLKYFTPESAFFPKKLLNIVNQYNPQTHFLVSFKGHNYLKNFCLELPDKQFLNSIKPAKFKANNPKSIVFPEELILSFISNNYYLLAAISNLANKIQPGIILCNIGLTQLSTSQYLTSKIKDQSAFDKLGISFDSDMLNQEKSWDIKILEEYNPSLNILIGFKKGKDFNAKLVNCQQPGSLLPKDCYRVLPHQLQQIVNNLLR